MNELVLLAAFEIVNRCVLVDLFENARALVHIASCRVLVVCIDFAKVRSFVIENATYRWPALSVIILDK